MRPTTRQPGTGYLPERRLQFAPMSGHLQKTPERPGVILMHEDEDPPAVLGDWLEERGIAHRVERVWEDGVPANPREFGWVAALGSYHSATQNEPRWIPDEVDFLRRAVDADVPVLGICFGGQALALALGGEISPADPVSIGWWRIESEDPSVIPEGPWAHHNYERFSVPERATLLARSPSGPGAFRLGPHLGLQFHPEATPAIVTAWAEEDAKLADHGFDPAEIRAAGERHGPAAAAQAFELFDMWFVTAGLRGTAARARR